MQSICEPKRKNMLVHRNCFRKAVFGLIAVVDSAACMGGDRTVSVAMSCELAVMRGWFRIALRRSSSDGDSTNKSATSIGANNR